MTRASVTCISRDGRTLATDLDALLLPELREQARAGANAWIKRLRLVRYDGLSMRDRFTYRGDSLWWFTELYLHKTRRLDAAMSTVLALGAAIERHEPARLVVASADPVVGHAARAFGDARRIPVEVEGPSNVSHGRRDAWSSYLIGLTARLPRWRPTGPAPAPRPAVAAFVHTAFWKPADGEAGAGQETYIGPVLEAVAEKVGAAGLSVVGVGPRRNFRARRWWDPITRAGAVPASIAPIERLAPARALREAVDLWRRRAALSAAVTAGDEVRAAAVIEGCDLWTVLRAELDGVARLQWPWSARAMDEAGAALDALAPRVVLTYAEAGGWGRALVLEARRRRMPSVGLQHGFIYRHWLNYLHERDEMAATDATPGCPIPDRTLVFDEYTRAHLLSAGRFPERAVTVTGSPRLDDLVARVHAARANRPAGPSAHLRHGEERVALLAAKHAEIGGVLGDLARAVASLPRVRLVVKPHPAETPDVYHRAIAQVPNISVADAGADLAALLADTDAIITMNSTVAIDGIVLGIPALVVGLPNNLGPFVEAGVMAGGVGAEGIRTQLEALLYDAGVRRSLAEAGRRFGDRFGMRADGRAADRTAAEILALASAR